MVAAKSIEENVEKGRQLRSRLFVVLTYWPVRPARQRACGLAGRTPRLREGMLFEHSLESVEMRRRYS